MQIIVLAGGEGKRMWPVATDKCLIPFLGKPLIYHNLLKIRAHLEGVKAHLPGGREPEFIIISNPHSKDKITEIAQSLNLNFEITVQNEPKGMADAILSAKDLIGGEILVLNAEDILDIEEIKTDGDVVLTGLKVNKYFPGGYLLTEGESVNGIVEKPGEGNEPSDMVKLVADYFKDGQKLVEYLEKASTDNDDQYEVALDQMIKDGLDVKFSKYSGVWIPLKYPWHILDITAYFLSSIDEKVYPGKIIIEEGAKVFDGATIKGPCYIGRNVIVGTNSMVRESDLEEGCVTGFGSDITRSYVGSNSWFHTNYVGDSVLEGDFGMGSGAVLANLRLDGKVIRETERTKLGLIAGKGVRMGVNSSTMPGVKIGSNSLVGPGVVLKEDLGENQKIIIKHESYEIKEYEATPTKYDQFRDKLK
ncbi:NTP transferase domain-containing protein [Candidatus Daviesbacteria bacterium]|nr:NTP transferase domain-containing protein [Candidatus Daviesbacteria bacterium]